MKQKPGKLGKVITNLRKLHQEKNFMRQGLPNDQLSEMGGLLSEDQIGH